MDCFVKALLITKVWLTSVKKLNIVFSSFFVTLNEKKEKRIINRTISVFDTPRSKKSIPMGESTNAMGHTGEI